MRQPRVDAPGSAHVVADPGVGGVVGEAPRALARPRHHVQVVEVVAGRRHRGPVVAVRHQDDVAVRTSARDVDLASGAGRVDALVAEAAARDLEVVDLLERGLLARALLVVLVRRIRRPVAAGREHLDGDQPVGLEGVRRAEVVDLAAGLARAAQLDRHVLGGDVARPPGGARPGRRAGRTGRRRSEAMLARARRAARRRSRVTAAKTSSRPSSVERLAVAPRPRSRRPAGSTISSSSPVSKACSPPGASSSTRRPLKPQPASSRRDRQREAAVGRRAAARGAAPRQASTASSSLRRPRPPSGIASAQASREATMRAGGVAEAHHPLELPARQQPVAQRAAERVAGAEAVDHLDRHGRDLDDRRRRRRPARPSGPA